MLFQCHALSCHIWAVFHVVVLASSWWWKNSFAHPLWRSDKESFRMHILENFLLFTDLMENNAENLNGTFLKLCIYDKSFYFIMSTQLTADIYQVIHLLFKELLFFYSFDISPFISTKTEFLEHSYERICMLVIIYMLNNTKGTKSFDSMETIKGLNSLKIGLKFNYHVH